MIIDSSAICACLFKEPEESTIIRTLAASASNRISAPTLVELQAVIEHRNPRLSLALNRLLAVHHIVVTDFTAEQAAVAREAYRIYGKASKHKANLNMGDCFSYALAITSGEPLLYVGDDFKYTDVPSALKTPAAP